MTKTEYLEVITYLRSVITRYFTRYPMIEGSCQLRLAPNKRDLVFSYGVITEKGIESRSFTFVYDEDVDQFTYTSTTAPRQIWITLDYDTDRLYQAAKCLFPGPHHVS